jgi:hypothetical protein
MSPYESIGFIKPDFQLNPKHSMNERNGINNPQGSAGKDEPCWIDFESQKKNCASDGGQGGGDIENPGTG